MTTSAEPPEHTAARPVLEPAAVDLFAILGIVVLSLALAFAGAGGILATVLYLITPPTLRHRRPAPREPVSVVSPIVGNRAA